MQKTISSLNQVNHTNVDPQQNAAVNIYTKGHDFYINYGKRRTTNCFSHCGRNKTAKIEYLFTEKQRC